MALIHDIKRFFTIDLWRVKREEVSATRYFCYGILKKLMLAIEWFTAKRMVSYASALTYSTLLAIVPILAVVFAVARGFGYNKYIETWFRDILASQPQAADIIVGFVNSYLVHTKSGIFLGIGLVFMLFTVLMLINNIETTFNDIWQVKHPRSIFRTITDYVAMLMLVPIVLVLTAGLSIMVTTIANNMEYMIISKTMHFLLDLAPFVLLSCTFIALYVFMPNTKVYLKHALIPGVLSGVAMQLLQIFYINSQIWVSSYNAIYGSFAALPLFMLWLQISWTICLFGAELTYTNQNLEQYAFRASTDQLSHRYKLMLSAVIMQKICKRFDKGEPAYTALQLKLETNIPIRIMHDLLYDLCQEHLLTEVNSDEKGEESVYQPAESINRLSVGVLIDRLEARGHWNLDINTLPIKSKHWKTLIANRSTYLANQRELLLKDL